MSEQNKIYLNPNADRTWSASISSAKLAPPFAELMEEPAYPVSVYYARTDINGSSVIEADKCSSRDDLLVSLNWIGKCCHSLLSVGSLDCREALPNDVVEIFDNAYHLRCEILREAANEMYNCFSEEPDVQEAPVAGESKSDLSDKIKSAEDGVQNAKEDVGAQKEPHR